MKTEQSELLTDLKLFRARIFCSIGYGFFYFFDQAQACNVFLPSHLLAIAILVITCRVVPKFWKDCQYQNFDNIGIDIDVEMEEDIDTKIDIEKFMRFWYWYWEKYFKILSLY